LLYPRGGHGNTCGGGEIHMQDLNLFAKLLDLLNRLRSANLAFELSHSRSDAVMVTVKVPGELWEIEFLIDGEVQVEVFRSGGGIEGPSLIDELFNRHAD
jgi:hypothetical protein